MSESNDDLDRLDKVVQRNEWPVAEGRYKVGNPDSPIAVCTMASVEMDLPTDKIAITGKCVTENLGIEKIIKNTISNPKIRYIIFCGKESHGHFVGQAVKSLKENGVDGDKKIIGAKGGMPILKNLEVKEIERFREQIEPIDMTSETDTAKILARVNELFERNPGPFEGGSMEAQEEVRETRAEVHPITEWVKDSEGFFTIYPNAEREEIVAEHHDNEGKIKNRIFGKSAEDIYHHIIKSNLVSRYDHAAYLGRELVKAELAMRNQMDYEQDADLKIMKQNIEQTREPVVPREPEISRPVLLKPAERKPERKGTGRFLTYIKGLKEIKLEDATNPDHEFRALLRERGMSRIF
jgi:tetrahydromethanopterin S-methyltransferase subunit A